LFQGQTDGNRPSADAVKYVIWVLRGAGPDAWIAGPRCLCGRARGALAVGNRGGAPVEPDTNAPVITFARGGNSEGDSTVVNATSLNAEFERLPTERNVAPIHKVGS
jgi:hypothetical protein